MYEGILPLWKEKGMTSHDCVFKLRKILKMKRIGHTGTLDPSVEGVLPICLGQATKVSEYIMNEGKTYVATVTIGSSTTTEDADGDVVKVDSSEKQFSIDQIKSVLQQLTGQITQTPPMYSAVKVNGKKLYEYAREGKEVERPSRQVTIHYLNLLDEDDFFSGQEISFQIEIGCSKGTYIRTLAVQIGELLGYPAHMSSLVRTASGNFNKSHCLTLQEVQEALEEGVLDNNILPIKHALAKWPSEEMDESLKKWIANGAVLELHPLLNTNDKVVFTEEGQPVAVYIKHPTKNGMMKPEKMFSSEKGV
ncbi:tRNA pseudouridine(55) synthase TruB [Psychrobacillus sp. BL-248-WT-3]|uniref:tRNA pseudouridine(55) synthase TruB n=1 Tax=Psychrobacillus sp. BL-248-WT-3 TaxID=2725306 RepID=UPI00146B63C8|nr:tRNA pseudouridine(55) synthase TruB [Psychrobacillus sp. BL-248-WT-3]NME04882.1 tRNA pseudouridine(55) synthase TruB [Psychrobacillus sp. BL-248-WT-3]